MKKLKFELGEMVWVGNDINGVVEEIIFRRGVVTPLYNVAWWLNGEHKFEVFLEDDLGKDG